jgi:DNA-binding response OmpR family regulator
MILENSQRLHNLIDQILDLARFDSGKMKLEASCQDIISFLEGIISSFHVLAQQNNLDIQFQSKEKNIFLYFDVQKMEEVMFNLLINAVKFTPSGGKIFVKVSKEDQEPSGFVEISVQDTGVGFSKEHADFIFDRFYQASNPDETNYPGTGIGLALTKEIILLHYGTITVKSREGVGTEFIIRLSLGNKHLKAEEIKTSIDKSDIFKKSREFEKFSLPLEMDADVNTAGKIPIEQDTILIVDDNHIFRKYVRGRIEPLYKVLEAINGQDGINQAKENIPDLIISDIIMPGINGYELCNTLKRDIKTSHIPIILLTAKAMDDDIIKGLKTGADDYITKPFNIKILIARIKNLIDRRHQLQLKRKELTNTQTGEIPTSNIDDVFLKSVRDIVKKNFTNPGFNETQLCMELNVTLDFMSKKINALTGETPNEFILSYRLKRAAHLLKDNSGSVGEIAFQVGFSSTAEFARCFKERFLQLPTAFQTIKPVTQEPNGY